MEIILIIVMMVLIYKMSMPFIAWIVPQSKMETAAKYIERTERRFPTKAFTFWINKISRKRNDKKDT